MKTNKIAKSLVSVLVTMCLFSAYGCGGYRPHLNRPGNADDFEGYLESTVAFVDVNEEGMFGPYCTGFYISARRLATAAHCVSADASIEHLPTVGTPMLFLEHSSDRAWRSMTPSQRRHQGMPNYVHSHVIGIDTENDVAVLELDESEQNADHWFQLRDIANEPISVGERVYSISNPTGTAWMFMEGVVSRVETINDGTSDSHMRIMHQVRIGPGSSGSELFDEAGRVIGINVSITRDGAYISQAIPVSYLQLLLSSIDG